MSLSRNAFCAAAVILGACDPSGTAVDAGPMSADVAIASDALFLPDVVASTDAVSAGDAIEDRAAPVDAPPPTPWVRALDASFLVTPNAVVSSPDGRVCVVGDFQGDLRAQGRSVTSSGASDGFVACFAPDGALLGLFASRVPGDDAFTAAVWVDDGLVVAGHIPAAGTLGGVALSSAGGVDVVMARFDTDGRVTARSPSAARAPTNPAPSRSAPTAACTSRARRTNPSARQRCR